MGILSKAWSSVKKVVKKTHEFGVKIAKADFKLHKKIFKETVSKPFKKIWENKLLRYVAIAAAIVVGGYFLAPVIFGGGGAAAVSGAGVTAAGSTGAGVATGAVGATGAAGAGAAGAGAAAGATTTAATAGFNAAAAEAAIGSAFSAELGAAATVPTLGSVGSTVGAGGVAGAGAGAAGAAGGAGAAAGGAGAAAGGITLGDAATAALISTAGSAMSGYADGKAAEEAAKEEERRYNAQSAYGLRRDEKYENAYAPQSANVSPAAYQPNSGYMSQSKQAANPQELPNYMRGNA